MDRLTPVCELLSNSGDDDLVTLSVLFHHFNTQVFKLLLTTCGDALKLSACKDLAVLVFGRGIASGEGSCVSDNRRALKTGSAGLRVDDGVAVGFQFFDKV